MIIISDCSKNIVIPAGLGDNAGVVYETAGVKSLNGETGDVKIKTVNGQSLMGEGDVPVDVGVETLNGQKGALTLKTVNGNELTGDGNIEIKAGVESVNGKTGAVVIPALQYFEVSQETKKEAYDEIANHWDDNSGYTGDCIFCYKKNNGGFYTFTEIGYLKDHSVYFSWLNNEGAYSVGNGKVKCFAIIIWYNAGNPSLDTYQQDCTIPTKVSELTNDSEFQTKAEVDTAIENAVSGGGSTGSDNVIVLDGLTQEEVKAIYDKLDKTKVPNTVFIYQNSSSFRTYWDGEGNLNFNIFRASYEALELKKITVEKTGNIRTSSEIQSYTNSCVIRVNNHINESDPFECEYIGSFLEYLQRVYNKPYAYFIWFNQGYGDSTKPVYTPFSVIWDNNNYDGGNDPVRIQFIANEKLYTYLHGDADGKWLFESAKPIGGVQSSEVSNIKVLTQSEYDALTTKDENVLYCIKG